MQTYGRWYLYESTVLRTGYSPQGSGILCTSIPERLQTLLFIVPGYWSCKENNTAKQWMEQRFTYRVETELDQCQERASLPQPAAPPPPTPLHPLPLTQGVGHVQPSCLFPPGPATPPLSLKY